MPARNTLASVVAPGSIQAIPGTAKLYTPSEVALPPASDVHLIHGPGSYRDLWHKITFSDLLYWDLLCAPYRLNGGWVAAMRRPVRFERVGARGVFGRRRGRRILVFNQRSSDDGNARTGAHADSGRGGDSPRI